MNAGRIALTAGSVMVWSLIPSSAQRSGENPADAVLNLAVWGGTTIDVAAFPEPLRTELVRIDYIFASTKLMPMIRAAGTQSPNPRPHA